MLMHFSCNGYIKADACVPLFMSDANFSAGEGPSQWQHPTGQ